MTCYWNSSSRIECPWFSSKWIEKRKIFEYDNIINSNLLERVSIVADVNDEEPKEIVDNLGRSISYYCIIVSYLIE